MKHQFKVALAATLLFASCQKGPEPLMNTGSEASDQSVEMKDFNSIDAMNDHLMDATRQWEKLDQRAAENFYATIETVPNADINELNGLDGATMDKLKAYHLQRIDNIKKLRQQEGFISLQSLVDEMNSLLVTDPREAQALAAKHSDMVIMTDYGFSTVTDPVSAQALNAEGFVVLEGQIFKYEKEVIKVITDGDASKINDLNDMHSSSSALNVEVLPNNYSASKDHSMAPSSIYIDCREGQLPASQPFYMNTYHTGVTIAQQAFVQLGSWWNTGSQYVLYPSNVLNIKSGTVQRTSSSSCGNIDQSFNKAGSGTINTAFGPTKPYCSSSSVYELYLSWKGVLFVPGYGPLENGDNFYGDTNNMVPCI